MPEPERSADWQVEQIMGTLLRTGVTLAAILVLAGGIVYLARHGMEQTDLRVFRGEPADLDSLEGIVVAAWSGRGRGIIQLGLLVLIATPVARVAFSAVAFAWERDWIYVAFTLIVLGVLLYSLFFAKF
jgi:uncharacterized membrane protein